MQLRTLSKEVVHNGLSLEDFFLRTKKLSALHLRVAIQRTLPCSDHPGLSEITDSTKVLRTCLVQFRNPALFDSGGAV